MDIRPLTPAYAVAPQIAPQDFSALAEAGYTTVICNRPDTENPEELGSDAMAEAAASAGVDFHYVPVMNGALGPEQVEAHRVLLDAASGPVFAYCRSGTRSSIIWALGQKGRMPTDEILSAAAGAGYDLSGLRGELDA
ncbi:TIGR01244 family phosphatase [Mesobaculum littorinae]|uniref:TIGR01244 family phosphatase n=1 Tax=Mesobaculum littorinae TaxID=2486419 RepID=A0A438AKG0_9RHOB|nr:TIGR01244 family sulfur transferase [Mesobaculum littorinae]RVV99313.1 TIGR01244 family phosphatase [Mesobaculum littorinae]